MAETFKIQACHQRIENFVRVAQLGSIENYFTTKKGR
jgi:hypothetical protein